MPYIVAGGANPNRWIDGGIADMTDPCWRRVLPALLWRGDDGLFGGGLGRLEDGFGSMQVIRL